MAGISIKITNLIPETRRAMLGRVSDAVDETAKGVKDGWQQRAPVLTGHYRGQVKIERDGPTSATVSNNTEYGPFLEYGTVNRPARPSMTPAVETERPRFEARLRKIERG